MSRLVGIGCIVNENNIENFCPKETSLSNVNAFLELAECLAHPDWGGHAALMFWKLC